MSDIAKEKDDRHSQAICNSRSYRMQRARQLLREHTTQIRATYAMGELRERCGISESSMEKIKSGLGFTSVNIKGCWYWCPPGHEPDLNVVKVVEKKQQPAPGTLNRSRIRPSPTILRETREYLGLTQTEMGRLMDTSKATIGRLESESTALTRRHREHLYRIATAVNDTGDLSEEDWDKLTNPPMAEAPPPSPEEERIRRKNDAERFVSENRTMAGRYLDKFHPNLSAEETESVLREMNHIGGPSYGKLDERTQVFRYNEKAVEKAVRMVESIYSREIVEEEAAPQEAPLVDAPIAPTKNGWSRFWMGALLGVVFSLVVLWGELW